MRASIRVGVIWYRCTSVVLRGRALEIPVPYRVAVILWRLQSIAVLRFGWKRALFLKGRLTK